LRCLPKNRREEPTNRPVPAAGRSHHQRNTPAAARTSAGLVLSPAIAVNIRLFRLYRRVTSTTPLRQVDRVGPARRCYPNLTRGVRLGERLERFRAPAAGSANGPPTAVASAMCGPPHILLLLVAVTTQSSSSTIALPPADTVGLLPLEQAIAARRSGREFTSTPLTLEQVGQLLWAAQGITEENGFRRAAPSPRQSYLLDIYALGPQGVFHYLPEGHRVEVVDRRDLRPEVADALGKDPVRDGALAILVAAKESFKAFFGTRWERYTALEAGHAAQNVLLQATALGLAAVPLGTVDDGRVRDLLGLKDAEVMYAIAVGQPA
jgi:SagB-type dehydrogenase family enzyme